jgi:hypothetical protein
MYPVTKKKDNPWPSGESAKGRVAATDFQTNRDKAEGNQISIPPVNLPKAGALKGIYEKFVVNAVYDTASFSIPLFFIIKA